VYTLSTGVDHVLTTLVCLRPLVATNGAGVYAILMDEFVIAGMLQRAKRLTTLRQAQARREWVYPPWSAIAQVHHYRT
jgi:phosphoglycerate dehydrogenase-like enzyme